MCNKSTDPKPAGSEPTITVGANVGSDVVVAKMPQGYDTKINIRFVRGGEIQFSPEAPGCRPRQGATRRDTEPVPLPDSLTGKLKDANEKVINWLAQDEANSRLFLSRPSEALIKAGVDLTRSEQKALDRAHQAVRDVSVIAPGVRITQFSASAHPLGTVGDFGSSQQPKDEPR